MAFRATFHGGGVYTVTLESQLKSDKAARICEYPTGNSVMNYSMTFSIFCLLTQNIMIDHISSH